MGAVEAQDARRHDRESAGNGKPRDRQRSRPKPRDVADDVTSRASGRGDAEEPRGGDVTFTGELRQAIREAAIDVVKPVARKATTSAAKYAVTRGPSLLKDKVASGVTDRLEDAGGAGALTKGLAAKGGEAVGGLTDKLPGRGGKKKGGKKAATGTGRGRRLPVQEFVDVAVPIDVAYAQYTQFEEFPRFMHRVEKVEQRDDTTLIWHENVWGVRRQWECDITDQTPDERIAWRSTDDQMIGVVTFHELADRLTRVYVNLDFQPHGILEKSASGLRHSRRALASDLMRFKAYVEMKNDTTGSWEGRIEDGEMVEEEDDRDDDVGRDEDEEPRGRRDEEEPEDDEEDADEDDEEEERPAGRSSRRRRAEEDEDEDREEDEDGEEERPAGRSSRRRRRAEEDEDEDRDKDEDDEEEERPAARAPRRRRRAKEEDAEPDADAETDADEEEEPPRRTRSRRPKAARR